MSELALKASTKLEQCSKSITWVTSQIYCMYIIRPLSFCSEEIALLTCKKESIIYVLYNQAFFVFLYLKKRIHTHVTHLFCKLLFFCVKDFLFLFLLTSITAVRGGRGREQDGRPRIKEPPHVWKAHILLSLSGSPHW